MRILNKEARFRGITAANLIRGRKSSPYKGCGELHPLQGGNDYFCEHCPRFRREYLLISRLDNREWDEVKNLTDKDLGKTYSLATEHGCKEAARRLGIKVIQCKHRVKAYELLHRGGGGDPYEFLLRLNELCRAR